MASRQASSPVSEAAVAMMRSAWLSASGPARHGRGDEVREGVADRVGASLDQPVRVEQQRVAGLELHAGLPVAGGPVHSEEQSLGKVQRPGDAVAHEDGRQVPGPRPAQHPGLRVVPAADHRPGAAVSEVDGTVVELA